MVPGTQLSTQTDHHMHAESFVALVISASRLVLRMVPLDRKFGQFNLNV